MESLARLFLAATDLLEAEGLALKRQIARLVIAAGLGLIILVLVMTGLGFLVFSLYAALVTALAPAGAAAVVGVAVLLLAWGVFLCIRRLLRPVMRLATGPEPAASAQARSAVIDAARAVDPLAPLRKQPLLCVGVAAGIGALLGMNADRLFSQANLSRASAWLARAVPLTLAAMQ